MNTNQLLRPSSLLLAIISDSRATRTQPNWGRVPDDSGVCAIRSSQGRFSVLVPEARSCLICSLFLHACRDSNLQKIGPNKNLVRFLCLLHLAPGVRASRNGVTVEANAGDEKIV